MASIGNEVRDGFKQTQNWANNNIEFLTDVEQFYRQRSLIEKEYATSLLRLSSEFLKKKAAKTIGLSVGNEPLITPGSLESSTVTVWNQILTDTEAQANNHGNFSKELNFKICDVILQLQSRSSGIFKSLESFHNDQLLIEKNEFSKTVDKFKKNYDESCSSMESARTKLEKKDSSKLQSKYNDKEFEMNAMKNDYLIKINVANRIKDKFYYQDLPELLDLIQDLNEFKTKNLNKVLNNVQILQTNLNNKNNKILNDAIQVISANNPNLDSEMFIKHNSNNNQWSEPQDFYYIPCSIWHDDENLVTKDRELNELKKTLIRSKGNISKVENSLEERREELSKLSQLRKSNKSIDPDDKDASFSNDLQLLNNYLKSFSKFVSLENKKVEGQVEIETIENNVDLSKDLSLDGLTVQKKKKGFFSKLTGGIAASSGSTASHRKEELVDTYAEDVQSIRTHDSSATSGGGGGGFKLGSLLRAKSMASRDSESVISSTVTQGTAVYPYESQGDDEVSLYAQESFSVVQLDDGSGWTTISKNDGSQGLVPTSYIQVIQSTTTSNATPKKKGPEVKPRKNNSKKLTYCIVKFSYQQEDEGELTINEGEKLVVLQPDDDGWTLGENANGEKGLFPSSYAEIV